MQGLLQAMMHGLGHPHSSQIQRGNTPIEAEVEVEVEEGVGAEVGMEVGMGAEMVAEVGDRTRCQVMGNMISSMLDRF